MLRGCLTLLLGFILGAGLMLVLWPRPPSGMSAPASSDLRIFMSDSYLTRMVNRRLPSGNAASIGNVRVASNPPATLVVRLDLSLGPFSAPATLELAPEVQNGQARTRVVSSQIAGLPVPSQLSGFVADAINSRTSNVMRGAGTITAIRVLPAGLQIYATYP